MDSTFHLRTKFPLLLALLLGQRRADKNAFVLLAVLELSVTAEKNALQGYLRQHKLEQTWPRCIIDLIWAAHSMNID